MIRRTLSVLITGLLVASLISGVVTADPPRPGTENNGLTENESATLWSRDTDTYITQTEYRQQYGANRSVVHQVANGTDITFKRPPATAATWTRNDFQDLDAGGANTSIHPPHADLEDGRFIADAHATFFGIHPATRGHLDANTTPLYVAPNGTVRGLVDYRVRVPSGSADRTSNSTAAAASDWSVVEHDVSEVQLQTEREIIAETNGSQTPVVDYNLDGDWRATLTLKADITVRLKQTTRVDGPNGTAVNVSYHTGSRTVSDSIAVAVYDLAAQASYAEYPNGDTAVAVFQSRPWHGYTITDEDETRVRGIWRFYTARDADWDTLVRSKRTGTTTVESDALPVYVHAYPSEIGPRTEPVRDGPDLIETWGTPRSSPRTTIGENVSVDVVSQSYTPTDGVAVRAETVDRDALRVSGLVQGVNTSVDESISSTETHLRRSDLSVEVTQQNHSSVTLTIALRDRRTNTPIALDGNPDGSNAGRAGTGYITVADQRVRTNASGMAIVTVDEPGIYTARYHPGLWLGQDSAYVGDTATARWHPLGTLDGWVALVVEVGWQLLPFLVMFYAGKRLLRMLGPEDIFHQYR